LQATTEMREELLATKEIFTKMLKVVKAKWKVMFFGDEKMLQEYMN
jgi:hypothetical protein